MLRKRIDKYVDRVVAYLPLLDRRKARAVITAAIYARLDDLTDGARPTSHDLRLVLTEMGHPRLLADAYYEDFHKSLWKKLAKKTDVWKFLHGFMMILTVAALVLVASGLVELIMGIGTMHGFAVGLVLGVIVVFYQMLIQPRVPLHVKEQFD